MVHSISYLYYMINFLHLKHPQDIVSWRELLVKDWVLYVLGKMCWWCDITSNKSPIDYTELHNIEQFIHY